MALEMKSLQYPRGGLQNDDLGRTRRWESECQYTYSVVIPEDWELVAEETPERTSAIPISEQGGLRLHATATATEMRRSATNRDRERNRSATWDLAWIATLRRART
jgi:hypothetical protein